jgi:1-deoxy-D-xylulose-5-phosphate reductoisomerase
MVMRAQPSETPGRATSRRINIFGSTGSIGLSTLDLIRRNANGFTVGALTANSSVEALAEQARELRPELAVVADEGQYQGLKSALAGTGIRVAAGRSGLLEAADLPADWTMAAIVGTAGLEPTLKAMGKTTSIGLANKECLVSAGELFMREINRTDTTLLPVDSEHSAIFQVLDFDLLDQVERIVLTASGGPFREWPLEKLEKATRAQALNHPNWNMGAKITVDSATMMNKGLELIEAHYLFPVGADRIEVVVHPQSIIHSFVEYTDSSILAQMGMPDMRTPIACALAWPERMNTPVPRLDLAAIGSLTFEAPDERRFPALRLAREALRTGNGAPTIMNAANEIAVAAFIADQLTYLNITRLVEDTLETAAQRGLLHCPKGLDEVMELDGMGRHMARELLAGRKG